MENRRDTILIVDDVEINRAVLRGVLEQDYRILEAENGDQAMLRMEQFGSEIALVLLDVAMPVKDGCWVLEEMGERGYLARIPVIAVTSEGTADQEVRAFDLGASDIVMKPFEPHVIRRRVQNIVELNRHKLHLEELVEEQAQSLMESNEAITDALSSVIEYRSMESGQHILRIRMFTRILLQDVARSCPEYDLDEQKISIITQAAAMHDIGKIAIPDSILNKPGRLTDAEFEIMKTHTTQGCAMLERLERFNDVQYLFHAYNICRYHHERWDGGGYPDGLKGDNIPICAQVVGVADCYDALTNDRVYKKAYTHERAMNMILNGECGAFSPKLLECLKHVGEQFGALAQEYSDGRSPSQDFTSKIKRTRPIADGIDKERLVQNKYFTLLRYLNATVLEVDLDADIYHVVYTANADFDLLRTGGSFRRAYRAFLQGSVCPEDRDRVESSLDGYIDQFFEDGQMKRSREYRVFQRSTGEYCWYRAAILRTDAEQPYSRRAILIWNEVSDRRTPEEENEDRCRQSLVRNIPGGILQRRNDSRFTVVRVGEGFVSMFGYGEQELEQKFRNSFLGMLHPDDRESAKRQIRRQLNEGNTVELEYRVVCRDGSTRWVLDKGKLVEEAGVEYLYCVLVDVTQTKRAQEALRLTLERHQIIMDQTDDIIFEWDIGAERISYSHNWEKKFGYPPTAEEDGAQVAQSAHIHPDDRSGLRSLMKGLAGGAPYGEAEYRIARADGRYLWCRVRATTQFDSKGRPIKAVGVILDVEDEKLRAQALEEKAERDVLTGLLNKTAVQEQIKRYLARRAPEDTDALLILDVDNFKQVNDQYGHMFGDAVLTRIAEKLVDLFRAVDIIGRVGGDELLLFLPQITGRAAVEEQLEAVIGSFRSLFREEMGTQQLSCSIGVAYVPADGADFQVLFQRADRALYFAKSRGKNQFAFYDPKYMDSGPQLFYPATGAVEARADSGAADSNISQRLAQRAFQIIYHSRDITKAVNEVLEMVGEQYHVSRSYIFENSEDNIFSSNTFEWCGEGVEPQIDRLQGLKLADFGGYENNFNEDGVFYCPDIMVLPEALQNILAPQGIRSMLQCAIRDGGRFRGWIGFDENARSRLWTQDQIDALTLISELLSVVLLKERAQERTALAAQGLQMALDHQNAWIYIVDPDTYVMHFLNAKTRIIAPEACVGMTCYQAFFGRSTPCADCPVRGIREMGNRTMEVYNPVLKVWSAADATLIRWNGREACLLVCHDITPYKDGLHGKSQDR